MAVKLDTSKAYDRVGYDRVGWGFLEKMILPTFCNGNC